MNLQEIDIGLIKPDPNQPRKLFDEEAMERLAQSIKDVGVEHPLLIRKNGSGYVIVEGERRYKGSKKAGLSKVPCIIVSADNDDEILEIQLRSDCLKENLVVDELDKAIYHYWKSLRTSSQANKFQPNNDEGYRYVARQIGKSDKRIKIAVDRFEFKEKNPEFKEKVKNLDEGGYEVVNSTIAITSSLDDLPDVRKHVTKKAIELKSKGEIDNNAVKEVIKEIKERVKQGETVTKDNINYLLDEQADKKSIKRQENKEEKERERHKKAVKEGRADKTRFQMSVEQIAYINALDFCLMKLPKNPPKDWDGKSFQSACDKWDIIFKAGEKFKNSRNKLIGDK